MSLGAYVNNVDRKLFLTERYKSSGYYHHQSRTGSGQVSEYKVQYREPFDPYVNP